MPNPVWLVGGLGLLGAAAKTVLRRSGFLPRLGKAVCGSGRIVDDTWVGEVTRAGTTVFVELSRAREEGFAYVRLRRLRPEDVELRFELNAPRDFEGVWIPATFGSWLGTLSVAGEQVTGSGTAILKPTLAASTFQDLSNACQRLNVPLVHFALDHDTVEAHLFVRWKADIDEIAPVVRYTVGTLAGMQLEPYKPPRLWKEMFVLGAVGSHTRISVLSTLLRHHRDSATTAAAVADAKRTSHALEVAALADQLGAGVYQEVDSAAFGASLSALASRDIANACARIVASGAPVELLRWPGLEREAQNALYAALLPVWGDSAALREAANQIGLVPAES